MNGRDKMEFYSHWDPETSKGTKLVDHLRVVAESSKEIILSKDLNGLDKYILGDVAYLIGLSHDFGKYTIYFQKKLKGFRDKKDPLANHGLISSFFSFYLIRQYLEKNCLDNIKPFKYLPLIAFFSVKHHHGDLKNVDDDLDSSNLLNSGFNNISKQLENININNSQIKSEYSSLLYAYNIDINKLFDNLVPYEKKVHYSTEIEDLITDLDPQLNFKNKSDIELIYYFLVLLLYSSLIDSDKRHAGNVREIERRIINENLVESHFLGESFEENNTSNINNIRNEIRKSVVTNITNPKNINKKIFTITAPTGTGKTLTSLSGALKLRKLIKKHLDLQSEPRIIYSLPFTSIIDQNYNVFDKVLNQIDDFKINQSRYLLKHHHLSEIYYKTEDLDRESDIDESLALIESWESEVVVTTFIQLFYSLIGFKNKSLKKFHSIVNSIIILDEAQNIPIEYWNLVRTVLIGMTEYFNCRIILMTATKPLIFREGEYTELVDNYRIYFESPELNRVVLNIDTEKKELAEFCDQLNNWSKRSYLFVFNTIGSSLDFYSLLKSKIKQMGLQFKICYLSTNVLPKERRTRIKNIKNLLGNKNLLDNGEKIIVISTQLIEAGVDIDCECVYRDIGPLDSIIQVAGRCNRNKLSNKAEMHLVHLIDEKGNSFAKIYDPVLLDIVKNIFRDKEIIPESEFLQLIDDYFQQAKRKSASETKLIDSLYKLYFYDKTPDTNKKIPISNFKLIEEDFFKIDIFVEIDEDASRVREKFCEIKSIKDPLKRKKEFLKIKNQFYDYVISVSKDHAIGFKEGELGIVNSYEIELYYDKITGFKRNNNGGGNLIC
ncbi:CRISPR-associated helicase Cas3' [Methanosarcina sp. UBA411]|uniref:CRISPR-associated helicase Cas3' n=1 Tax=Methanosarcina sp. UBA411 TaxID=1915589 RepID=UPI0025F8A8E1|nr:CRISPR-associated helicase Cas3' [Methanosarcina sp. UBA411]